MAKFSVKTQILRAIMHVNAGMAKNPSSDLADALQRLLALYEEKKNTPTSLELKKLIGRIETIENRMKQHEEAAKKVRDNSEKQFMLRSLIGGR